jgi:uncharacterized protein
VSWIEGATGLTPLIFAGAFVMTLGAAGIRGLTGFGMAIILVPLLGMIMRPDHAVILAILLQLLIGPIGLGAIARQSDRKTAVPIALCAVATTPLGVWALFYTAPDVARAVIAGVAICAFLLVLIPAKPDSKPGLPLAIGTGAAAGILTGFAAMPGPPVVPFYIRGGYEAGIARASMMFIFFATAIAGTLSAWMLELIEIQTVLLSILLFPAVLLGNWLGGMAFGRIAPLLWRVMVGVILGIAGISAVVRLLH